MTLSLAELGPVRDVPLGEARGILDHTARAIGFQDQPAGVMAQAACRLSACGLDGAGYLLRYLLRVDLSDPVNEGLFNMLSPVYRDGSKTPFIKGYHLLNQMDAQGQPPAGQGLQVPCCVAPLLMLPMLAQFCQEKAWSTPAVTLRLGKAEISMDANGLRSGRRDPTEEPWLFDCLGQPLTLRFEGKAHRMLRPFHPRKQVAALRMPVGRLADGVIDLGRS